MFLKLPNLHMLIKQKTPSLPKNLALGTFGKLLTVFSIKVNLWYLLGSVDRRCCLLHLIMKIVCEKLSKNSNLDDWVSLDLLSLLEFIWNYIISLTPEMVKKVIMNLDLSEASGLDCIPVVVLKNFKHELCYILSELFNICLKESCLQIVGRFHQLSLYLGILGKGLELKTTTVLVFFCG